MITKRRVRAVPPIALAGTLLAIWGAGCDDPAPAGPGPSPDPGVSCGLTPTTLTERLQFADATRAAGLLGQPDDWARQLSAFERSARRRTLEPTTMEELLDHLSGQALEWTPEERTYWSSVVSELSAALAGLDMAMPDLWLVKTTGLDEFAAVYARNDAIMIPQGRVDISGDQRRDFFLLAHELFHALSQHDPALREKAYELLGFERFAGIDPPTELEGRRLSNPGGHTYEDALRVETPDGPADVVPFVRSTIPLDEVIELPTAGPPAIFGVLEILLLPVDTGTGTLVRGPAGELITYGFGNTDWPALVARNTSFIIHPEEVMADNFATLMERRFTGSPPSDANDADLLDALEDLLRGNCVP